MIRPRLPQVWNRQTPQRNRALPTTEGLGDDCALAAKVIEGDTAALARLLERHQARVNRYLQHRLGAGHEPFIQDVIKATFSDALLHIRPYARGTASTPMEYWLIRLAEHNLAKLQGIAGKAQVGSALAKEEVQDDGDLPIVRRALAVLPAQDSFVLALALFEGMSAPEIAATLGVGQVRALKRLRAALAAIRKHLPRAGGTV
ncbi:MAG: sigma factor-like helix-turn-helix DNA-binding protein [Chloroflexota bacterium]